MPASKAQQKAATATDEAMAKRAAEGDRTAFAELLSAYYERIHAMAWRWCGSSHAADDVAQDVCVKLASAIRSFSGDATFSTWVWRITYNAAVDHLRRARRLSLLGDHIVEALIEIPSDLTQPNAEAGSDLWSAVRTLPPQQRDCVLLVYAEDMSHAEAAAVMELSEATVSWHLHQARKTLKKMLEAAN
jgi:RNA polymerase sigma-70 factor (ECF subfamily)